MAERFDFETVNYTGPSRKNVIRITVVIVAVLVLVWLSPLGTIAAGERGVHLRFTAVTGKVFGEGLYFRIPLIESVQMMDVKVQKYEMKSDAASKDLQTVHSVVALNFHIDPDRVANMYQDVGLQFNGALAELRTQGLGVTVHNPSNETFYIKAEGIFVGYVVTGTELLELKSANNLNIRGIEALG